MNTHHLIKELHHLMRHPPSAHHVTADLDNHAAVILIILIVLLIIATYFGRRARDGRR